MLDVNLFEQLNNLHNKQLARSIGSFESLNNRVGCYLLRTIEQFAVISTISVQPSVRMEHLVEHLGTLVNNFDFLRWIPGDAYIAYGSYGEHNGQSYIILNHHEILWIIMDYHGLTHTITV